MPTDVLAMRLNAHGKSVRGIEASCDTDRSGNASALRVSQCSDPTRRCNTRCNTRCNAASPVVSPLHLPPEPDTEGVCVSTAGMLGKLAM